MLRDKRELKIAHNASIDQLTAIQTDIKTRVTDAVEKNRLELTEQVCYCIRIEELTEQVCYCIYG